MNREGKFFSSFMLLALVIGSEPAHAMSSHLPTNRAVDSAIAKYSKKKEPILRDKFSKAHVQYPPQKIALLAFKKEQNIELWAQDKQQIWRYVVSYPLTAFSGTLGPKLRENDKQIPEGVYKLTMFNPFSHWHLSMMVNYPNEFDREHAWSDHRKKLGGDIFLHGKNASIGCLAVGDNAIEQLFMLSRRVGLKNIELIIAPNDLRKGKAQTTATKQPRWLPDLYQKIRVALNKYPLRNRRNTG